jgi:hypothetical protein
MTPELLFMVLKNTSEVTSLVESIPATFSEHSRKSGNNIHHKVFKDCLL